MTLQQTDSRVVSTYTMFGLCPRKLGILALAVSIEQYLSVTQRPGATELFLIGNNQIYVVTTGFQKMCSQSLKRSHGRTLSK